MDKQIGRWEKTRTGRQIYKQTNRHTHTSRQADRQISGQAGNGSNRVVSFGVVSDLHAAICDEIGAEFPAH